MKVAGRKSSTAELAYPFGWMLVCFFFSPPLVVEFALSAGGTLLSNFNAIHYPEQKFAATGLQGWSLVMAQKNFNGTF